MLDQTKKVYQPNPVVVWRPNTLETAVGGFKLNTEGYQAGDFIRAGSAIYGDEITRVATVIQTFALAEAVVGSAQMIKVPANYGANIGMYIAHSETGTSHKIVSKSTVGGFEELTLDSPVTDLPKGTIFFKALETAVNGSVLFKMPNFLSYTEREVKYNQTIDGVTLGTVYERRIPPIPKSFKDNLKTTIFTGSK